MGHVVALGMSSYGPFCLMGQVVNVTCCLMGLVVLWGILYQETCSLWGISAVGIIFKGKFCLNLHFDMSSQEATCLWGILAWGMSSDHH